MKNKYTESEINQVKELRKSGLTWQQIGEKIGRNHKSLYIKFMKMKATGANSKRKSGLKKTRQSTPRQEPAQVQPRPMVAFIGSPAEITTTIRELFS